MCQQRDAVLNVIFVVAAAVHQSIDAYAYATTADGACQAHEVHDMPVFKK